MELECVSMGRRSKRRRLTYVGQQCLSGEAKTVLKGPAENHFFVGKVPTHLKHCKNQHDIDDVIRAGKIKTVLMRIGCLLHLLEISFKRNSAIAQNYENENERLCCELGQASMKLGTLFMTCTQSCANVLYNDTGTEALLLLLDFLEFAYDFDDGGSQNEHNIMTMRCIAILSSLSRVEAAAKDLIKIENGALVKKIIEVLARDDREHVQVRVHAITAIRNAFASSLRANKSELSHNTLQNLSIYAAEILDAIATNESDGKLRDGAEQALVLVRKAVKHIKKECDLRDVGLSTSKRFCQNSRLMKDGKQKALFSYRHAAQDDCVKTRRLLNMVQKGQQPYMDVSILDDITRVATSHFSRHMTKVCAVTILKELSNRSGGGYDDILNVVVRSCISIANGNDFTCAGIAMDVISHQTEVNSVKFGLAAQSELLDCLTMWIINLHTSQKTKESAMKAILNLSADSQTNERFATDKGVLSAVVEMASCRGEVAYKARKYAILTLINLARLGPNRMVMAKHPGLMSALITFARESESVELNDDDEGTMKAVKDMLPNLIASM